MGRDQGNGRWLEDWGRARRSGARNCREYRNNHYTDFKAVRDRHNGDDRRLRSDYGTRCRANRADVRGGRSVRQVGAKVELRAQENDSEEQRQNTDSVSIGRHVSNKTKLRWERLRGQERKPLYSQHLYTILEDSIRKASWHTPPETKKNSWSAFAGFADKSRPLNVRWLENMSAPMYFNWWPLAEER